MRVVVLEAPREVEAMLDERRRLGLDVRDEMWDGVLHRVAPPGDAPGGFSLEFVFVVGPIAKRRWLVPRMETGLFRSDDDYRVPDQLYRHPDQRSDRGAEAAELVVEVRSPREEAYEKIDFYSGSGVREMIVAHPPERRVELFRAVGGRLVPSSPGPTARSSPRFSGSPRAPSTARSRSPGTAVPPPSDRARNRDAARA